MLNDGSRTILLTGASGALGTELAARLSRDGDRVLCLMHRDTELRRAGGRSVPRRARSGGTVETVHGDVTRNGLGLDDETARTLLRSVDLIVHAAAVTDFGQPVQRYTDVNVRGTINVLEIARQIGASVVHVSTAYVAGRRRGLVLESELDQGQSFANDYERSKHEAELVVAQAVTDGVPVTVVRPSIVVGRRRDGVTRDFKNIYVMLKLVTSGRVSRVPGFPDATLDLVPVDDVVDVVIAAGRGLAGWTGDVLHAVGATVTLADISRVVAEYSSLALPEYVPPANFAPDSLPRGERVLYERSVRLFEPYLTGRARFDDRNAQMVHPHRRPTAETIMRRLLDHSLSVGYLGPRRATKATAAVPGATA